MNFIIFASLLAFAMAAPTSIPVAEVALRMTTSTSTYQAIGTSQHTLSSTSSTLQVMVGQTLSFDHAPLRVQSISISDITMGLDLGGKNVMQDDWRVVCKAKVAYKSDGWVFGMEDGRLRLSDGEAVDVTGLECWLEGDEALVV